MVFSKGGKNIGDKFKYVVNNSELEYVTSYVMFYCGYIKQSHMLIILNLLWLLDTE